MPFNGKSTKKKSALQMAEGSPNIKRVIFRVGDKFSSYASFAEKFHRYKQSVFNDYWIRDSRTLKNHKQRYPDGYAAKADDKLVYYHVKFACVKGGLNYTPRNTKRETFTLRQHCKAGMSLKLSTDAKYLVIREFIEEHSHPVSEALYKTLSQRKVKVNQQHKEINQELRKSDINKKYMQNNAKELSCSLATLKDLSNLNRKKKFDECIDILQNIYECDVQVLLENENILQGIYFQDLRMKKSFLSYPEMIFVECTRSLQESNAATYVIMAEDSEGDGEVVAVAILLDPVKENIEWFMEAFIDLNPMCFKTAVIMSDKDCEEKSVFRELFPCASLQICSFHTLQIFNKEVSERKMNISSSQCETAKAILHKMVYAKSKEEYKELYTKMKKTVAKNVVKYFDKNWHPIRSEWVLYLTYNNLCYMSKSNNRIENINQKLKYVIYKYSKLEDLIKNFFIVLNSVRVDKSIRHSANFHKISTKSYPSDTPQECYQKFLTHCAFEHVNKQLNLMNSVNEIEFIDDERAVVKSHEGILEVTSMSCECHFRTSMSLPCRHIFKFREQSNEPLYDETLCLERWTRSYFFSICEEFSCQNTVVESEAQIKQSISEIKKKPLTNHKKFKLMNDACLNLSKMCAEVSSNVFYERFLFIKNLCKQWSEGEESTNVEDLNARPSGTSQSHASEEEEEAEEEGTEEKDAEEKDAEEKDAEEKDAEEKDEDEKDSPMVTRATAESNSLGLTVPDLDFEDSVMESLTTLETSSDEDIAEPKNLEDLIIDPFTMETLPCDETLESLSIDDSEPSSHFYEEIVEISLL